MRDVELYQAVSGLNPVVSSRPVAERSAVERPRNWVARVNRRTGGLGARSAGVKACLLRTHPRHLVEDRHPFHSKQPSGAAVAFLSRSVYTSSP
jgi:hypothetical protein